MAIREEEHASTMDGENYVEEEVEEEEVEEEVEEVIEEEEAGEEDEGMARGEDSGREGEGGTRLGEPMEKRVGNVDSGGEEVKQAEAGSSSAGKIFVGGVAWDTTEETFSKHFSQYGEIEDSVIMKDRHTHMPRGFGFVTFADPSVIDRVLQDEHVIDGRTVEVKRTVPKEDMPSKLGLKTKKIFVGGLPTALTEDELKGHFSSYGVVVEHQIMFDHSTGRSRGFGFVTFENEDAVDKLISEGRMHDLGGKQVEIKRAEPKRPGGESGFNGRASHSSGGSARVQRGGNYGYGSGYRSADAYYGGGAGYSYGRGYSYGGFPGYGAGYGPQYGAGGPMYGGGYGAGNAYGGPGGYMYGAYGGGYGSGRGYGNRYHPYSR